MAIYEITEAGLKVHETAQFAALGLYERQDLQRLLRHQPEALGEDLLVIAEEFGQWADARRRIDLLALDRDGHLVVIELKRTDDGGHMELQALRYAAMVASIGLDELVDAHAAYLAHQPGSEGVDARTAIVKFLAPDDDTDPTISSDVRIVLVSANFSREITTTVLWLNRFDGMDIRCVKLVPYKIDERVLLDIQQVIPLPEAGDYQVKLRRKELARERATSNDGRDFTRYHIVVDGNKLPDQNKRGAIRVMVTQLVERGISPTRIKPVMPPRALPVVPGLITDEAELERLLVEHYPNVDVRRHWTTTPFLDEDTEQTFVLFKMWGMNTEPTLAALAEAFPEAKVGFRIAD